MVCLFLKLIIQYREYDLHAAVKVTRHPVRTAHVDFAVAVVLKIKDTAVL